MNHNDNLLADHWPRALAFEAQIKHAIVGQDQAVRLVAIAVFARGHVLLEGGVGVGKTTLLRAVARAIGGECERIEGTIDLMPSDLIYYTYLDDHGKPGVAPGPLLRRGGGLSTFFFNEINRARPQVHSLLLRVMAERAVTAFNREYSFPHLQVFADRNRVEKEETFELPAAARDRFMLEIGVPTPTQAEILDLLAFEPRFHDPDALLAAVEPGVLAFETLNELAAAIQSGITATPALKTYVRELWRAASEPEAFGLRLPDADSGDLIEAGPSPRGMSHLIRAARVRAWLAQRGHVLPEDVQAVFPAAMGHRIFLKPVYEYRRAELVPELVGRILRSVAAP
ncbi:MoxR-like ATPase [Methylomagnum ishizawai]|uniref:MoxR-like ATPase n=1 Tax=Methylomagnum ishizawai TaxID=1760988 RepID=A0A1Y6D217_9GAMM|nr:MoxR family ATPase [Methylomagnum ishizawai]SMF96626.1 MoxR-like ATPase [Methylomagnum ishizawai]